MEYISASLIEVFASDLLLIRRMGLQNADAVVGQNLLPIKFQVVDGSQIENG